MAHIQPRRTARGTSYRVRYVDPDGREKSRTFHRKAAAADFAAETEHRIRAGSYVDPAAGRVTVHDYLEQWRGEQAHHRPSTARNYADRFRTMVYPYLGHMPLARVKPSTVRSWQRQLVDKPYAAGNIQVVRGMVAGAFRDAVRDRLLSSSPFDGVKAPEQHKEQVVPLTVTQVATCANTITHRYQALVWTAAGTGMRRSELWGLTVDRVDFLRKTVRVDRQLVGRTRDGAPIFGPPKSKAGVRTIPIGHATIDELAAHLAKYPPGPHGLVFTTRTGRPISPGTWADAWHRARAAAGMGAGDGLHQLRHFYASLLIAAGRPVNEVQERLGHATAQETLDMYAHLFEGHEDGTRAAVDAALRNDENGATPKDDAAGTL